MKFCLFRCRSKDEFRAHHDREHRRGSVYYAKSCSLYPEVNDAYQRYGLNGVSSIRNAALVTIPFKLSANELLEVQAMELPTVSPIPEKYSESSFGIAKYANSVKKSDVGKVDKEAEETFESMACDDNKSDVLKKESCSPSSKEGVFVCYKCGTTNPDKKDHKAHARSCVGELRERLCRICYKGYTGQSFVAHCWTHINEGTVLCMLCNGLPFDNKRKLIAHFEKHVHEQFVYPALCPFCREVLPDVGYSLFHLVNKHNNPPPDLTKKLPFGSLSEVFSCVKCPKKFADALSLYNHKSVCVSTAKTIKSSSSNNGPISRYSFAGENAPTNPTNLGPITILKICLVCKKSMSQESLAKHMTIHLLDGVILCALCEGLQFESNDDLDCHLQEHSYKMYVDGKFSCDICQAWMSDQEAIYEHLKQEHGLTEMQCSYCDMSYNFQDKLKKHKQIVHEICRYAKRRYICWICRAFDHGKKDTVIQHFMTVHRINRDDIEESNMIRTRGQGSTPTSSFVNRPSKTAVKNKTSPSKSSELSIYNSPETNQSELEIETNKSIPSVSPTKSNPPISPIKSNPVECTNKSDSSPSLEKIDPLDTIEESIPESSDSAFEPVISKIETLPDSQVPEDDEISNDRTLSCPVSPNGTFRSDISDDASDYKHVEDFIKDEEEEVFEYEGSLPEEDGKDAKQIIKVDIKEALDESSDTLVSIDRSISHDYLIEPRRKPDRRYSLNDSRSPNKTEDKSKMFHCHLCNFATNFPENLDKHLDRHEKEKSNFKCGICNETFIMKESFKKHMLQQHQVQCMSQKESATDSLYKRRRSDSVERDIKRVKQDEEAYHKDVKLSPTYVTREITPDHFKIQTNGDENLNAETAEVKSQQVPPVKKITVVSASTIFNRDNHKFRLQDNKLSLGSKSIKITKPIIKSSQLGFAPIKLGPIDKSVVVTSSFRSIISGCKIQTIPSRAKIISSNTSVVRSTGSTSSFKQLQPSVSSATKIPITAFKQTTFRSPVCNNSSSALLSGNNNTGNVSSTSSEQIFIAGQTSGNGDVVPKIVNRKFSLPLRSPLNSHERKSPNVISNTIRVYSQMSPSGSSMGGSPSNPTKVISQLVSPQPTQTSKVIVTKSTLQNLTHTTKAAPLCKTDLPYRSPEHIGGGPGSPPDLEGPQRCHVCREDFQNGVLLKAHMRIHGMAFLKMKNRDRHISE